MKHYKRHRLWAVSIAVLALLSFVAGTSFACMQKGVTTVQMAEDCCRGYCQHVMMADMADQCCQSHQTEVAKILPASLSAKSVSGEPSVLPVAVIPPAVLQSPEQSWVRSTIKGRPPPFPHLYTLHCTLLL